MFEFNKEKIEEGRRGITFSLKRELSLQFKKTLSYMHKVHLDIELQKLYDFNTGDFSNLLPLFEQYNLHGNGEVYLATGLSCYFNDQIDRLGLANIRISQKDLEDVRFIQECFGKRNRYGDNDLKVLYTTLPGTTEIIYGMQPFPAGIYEDVFQFSFGHEYSVMPIFGESEVDYYCRNLEEAIKTTKDFPADKKDEVMERARRIANKFCSGKNRVYLIPVSNILGNKASFGDVQGLRDGSLVGASLQSKLDSMDSFLELTKKEISYVDVNFEKNRQQSVLALYSNPNFSVGERGIAIYGDFSNKGIVFFEIERKYDLMQKKARELGYVEGEVISESILYEKTGVVK